MTDAEFDRLRSDAALLRAIISRRVRLKRSGRRWKGLCPFHVEDTPSFTVFEDGHFHCFGCQAHGSVFDYVMKSEGIGFRDACDLVAGEAGTPPPMTPRSNGMRMGEDWHPILPVPDDAPRPTDKQLRCDILHKYHDARDRLLCYVRRIEARKDKGKLFLPLTFGVLNGDRGWHERAPTAPKPLYGLNRVSHAQPAATVLLCEGEKAADAARRIFPDMVGMSWMGGASADEHADLTPLAGRCVILWGDADTAGRKAVTRIAERLPNAAIVNTNGLPKGFDAADLEVSGQDDPRAWLTARVVPPERPHDSQQTKDLTPVAWTYRDPTEIPPRAWLLGTTLLRGYASILGSMGGVGKTAYAIAIALAVITGRHDILDQHVFQTGKVWFLTLEDDREELERRIAAAMIAHNIGPNEVEGRLFINTASERPLLLARANPDGTFIACEDVEHLVDNVRARAIGLTIIDPLVKAHALIENSNEHMDRLIGMANDIARDTRSAVLLAAHFRKGSSGDGARDAIRGGSALIDGSRIVRTLVPMTQEEAEEFDITPEEAFRYVRVQDAKANLAPKSRAIWFVLESIPLGNSEINPTYPAGDNVQAAKAWKLPTAFDGIDLSLLQRIFTRLRGEPEPGWFYSPDRRAKFWAGTVIMEEAGRSKNQAGTVLKTWLQNGVVTEANYKTPSRNDGIKVMLNDAKAAEILAPIRALNGGEE